MLLLRLIGALIAGAFTALVSTLVCGIIGTVFYVLLFEHGMSPSSIDASNPSTILQTPGIINAGTLIGVVCGILIGLTVFLQSVRYALKRERLSKGGIRISALVSNIQRHTYSNTGVNGSPSTSYTVYTVYAEWLDPRTGSRHRFKQEAHSRPAVREGEYVTVQINPQNYSDYYMEL